MELQIREEACPPTLWGRAISTGRAQVDPPKADARECVYQTHAELIECPERVAMAAAEKRADGRSPPTFKTVALAECGEYGISVVFAHLLHKGCERIEDCIGSNSVDRVKTCLTSLN